MCGSQEADRRGRGLRGDREDPFDLSVRPTRWGPRRVRSGSDGEGVRQRRLHWRLEHGAWAGEDAVRLSPARDHEPHGLRAMLLGLRSAIYHAPDLDAAKRWYSKALGVQPYFDEPFYVGFEVGGYELGLNPDPGARLKGLGGAVAYWGVADAEACLLYTSPSPR